MRKIVLGSLLALACIGGVVAKDMPALNFIQNAQPGVEQKINVAYYHIEELERKVAGMQKQITTLHATAAKEPAIQRSLDGLKHGTFIIKK